MLTSLDAGLSAMLQDSQTTTTHSHSATLGRAPRGRGPFQRFNGEKQRAGTTEAMDRCEPWTTPPRRLRPTIARDSGVERATRNPRDFDA